MRSAPATSKTRIIFLGAFAFLWLALLLTRLVDLQILRHADLAARAQRQQQRTLEITPQRGVIYDRNGRELAVSVGVDSLFAVPADVPDAALAAHLLGPALDMEESALRERLSSDRSFVWLQRKMDAEQAERVRRLNLAGIYFQREYKRFYPKRELAAQVLGFVGIDENGLAGIEYSLDKVIRGQPQRLLITTDGRRRTIERHNDVSLEGASVVLTLDENIQYVAEQELAAAMDATHALRGTILVQDPHNGEILALANRPTFNPNEPTAVPSFRHLNPAVSLAYEPGSTFKLVTVSGALEEGLTWPGEVIDCQQGSIFLAGHQIHDHKPFGLLTLREVIQESSDIGAIKIGLRLGNRGMYEHIRRWHFGQPTGIELPAESRGLLRPVRDWSQISIGAISMGQEVAITTLQLAAAISAVGNNGVWVQPHIVRRIIHAGAPEESTRTETDRIIPDGVAEELRRMLSMVVTLGTGREAQPAGYTAAGKTGTAQKIDETGRYSPHDYIASFAGVAPAENPAITVVVVLDTPRGKLYHGGEVAAPVFAKVVERTLAYLNVPRSLPVAPTRAGKPIQRAAVEDLRPNAIGKSEGFEPASLQAQAAVARRRLEGNGPEADNLLPVADSGTHGKTIVLADTDSVLVPDLTGLPLRAVTERLGGLGLKAALVGSGVATTQRPAPGTRVPVGSRVLVEFHASLPAAPARSM
jgi:cell division protein FtsI/penicillin-binding protein 2